MKKLALVSAAVLGFVSAATAAGVDTVNKSGFYVGVNGGYGFSKSKVNFVNNHLSHTLKGLLGGAQIGYQHDFGRFVGGLEIGTDFTKSHKNFNQTSKQNTSTFTSQGRMTRKNDYSVTLRMGYKVAPCWVAGVKIGYERNDYRYKFNSSINNGVTNTTYSGHTHFNHNGFVPGIYVEKLLNKHWMIGAEYGYGIFKQKTCMLPNNTKITHKPRTHDIKLRLGYKF